MPRRPITKKRSLLPDPIYNSISVHMLVNRVLKCGKKSVAYRIVYNALKEVGDMTNKNPVEVFEKALDNVTPRVEVKPRRRAGTVQLVPRVLRFTPAPSFPFGRPAKEGTSVAYFSSSAAKQNLSSKKNQGFFLEKKRLGGQGEKTGMAGEKESFSPGVVTQGDRARASALRWILEACSKRSGQPMVAKLKNEINDAYKGTGFAVRKRDELHKTAMANAMYARKPQAVINAVSGTEAS